MHLVRFVSIYPFLAPVSAFGPSVASQSPLRKAHRRIGQVHSVSTLAKPAQKGLFTRIEAALESLSANPQELLEAVVGLPGPETTYDRNAIIEHFQKRPAQMVARAIDFLQAFRRVRSAWEAGPADGIDRGAVLRRELAALGPIAVKLGQTLSQRPDILPEDVCEALKSLQTSSSPFPNEEAYQVIAEDFGAVGPIAPGVPVTPGCDPHGKTLFKAFTPDCIASASLGQVYRGTTHEGQEIAIKVQRPGALRQCLLDGAVLISVLKVLQGRFWNGDLLEVFDGTAAGIVQELDFRHEAKNAKKFRDSLKFLGYVDVPRTLPEMTTRRALAMEWVFGRHLSSLSPEEAMRMTYMSCEAVTAGLVLTGIVHADPHEGNIMLADDGRLVFLDFGLMSRVEEPIMEAFAKGIQCVLSKDYTGLVQAFIDMGFVGNPIEWRAKEADPWQLTHPKGDTRTVMANELRDRMEAAESSSSRFGALSVVLADMGFFWCMYTPPYIILLVRTFLTLEGIAGQVDPNFNIYEVALPWAVQRALSPTTASGSATLRKSLLTKDNKLAWDRVELLVEQQQMLEQEKKAKQTPQEEIREGDAITNAASSSRARLMSQEATKGVLDPALAAAGAEAQAAQAVTPLESLTTVLGSVNGKTLRHIARDLDSTHLMLKMASHEARPMRRMAVQKLANLLEQRIRSHVRTTVDRYGSTTATNASTMTQSWPSSEVADALQKRKAERARYTGRLLFKRHVMKQVQAGWRGFAAFTTLFFVSFRIGVAVLVRTCIRLLAVALGKLLPSPVVVGALTAASAAATIIGREFSDLGASLTNLADEMSIVARTRRQSGSQNTSRIDDESSKHAYG